MENQLLLVDPSKFGIQESSVKTLIGNLRLNPEESQRTLVVG